MDDAEGLGDFLEDVGGFQELVSFVGGADDGAQAGFAFGDSGVADGGGEDTGFEDLFGELKGFRRIAYVDGDDGGFAGLELEAALFQFALEEFGVGPEFFYEFFAVRVNREG